MLLFNKERVTDVNGTQDFNTSNVTIQPDPRSAFKTPISISIHLMLLFNVSLSFHCMCNNHFNTSNVTIQLIIIDSTTCTYLHFNTSNVTIQRGSFVAILWQLFYFNTSNVTIQHHRIFQPN